MSGSCRAPSRAAWERAKRARAAAKALFIQAMAEVDRVNARAAQAARIAADDSCGAGNLAPQRDLTGTHGGLRNTMPNSMLGRMLASVVG